MPRFFISHFLFSLIKINLLESAYIWFCFFFFFFFSYFFSDSSWYSLTITLSKKSLYFNKSSNCSIFCAFFVVISAFNSCNVFISWSLSYFFFVSSSAALIAYLLLFLFSSKNLLKFSKSSSNIYSDFSKPFLCKRVISSKLLIYSLLWSINI